MLKNELRELGTNLESGVYNKNIGIEFAEVMLA